MTREQALEEVRKRVKDERLVKHMLATEVAMRRLARHFGEDEDLWGLAGLLHDIDVEMTNADMHMHSKMGYELVKEMGLPEDIAKAILTHNEAHGIEPETLMAKVLRAVDPLTGLITAVALVMPDKKLSDVNVDRVLKRFKEKRFAAGANREQIAKCEEFGLGLEEFTNLVLQAMQSVSDELGL
ncbi:HD domain-containing protein [Coprothermobacteraceae bacterium]|nr:HD domain-containing protein [Coprothermobacteraceae bacterium]